MTTTQMFRRVLTALGIAVLGLPLAVTGQALKPRIVQTCIAADSVAIIDPATNRIIGEIAGIEMAHQAVASPDGRRIYVASEEDFTVRVVDSRTLEVVNKVTLTHDPNNLTITNDGRLIYVAIHGGPGGIDVVDTTSMTLARRIPLGGALVHNVYVTKDGKYLVAGEDTEETRTVAVIDLKTEQLAWSIDLSGRPRPMSFSTNPDGSTKWILLGLSGLDGFVAIDFATHMVIHRIVFPYKSSPVRSRLLGVATSNPNHGIVVTPDNKTVWVGARYHNLVYAYSLPDLKLIGAVPVGLDPVWLSALPDSRFVYVANAAQASVSVIDVQAVKEVSRIMVGQNPRRNNMLMLPDVDYSRKSK